MRHIRGLIGVLTSSRPAPRSHRRTTSATGKRARGACGGVGESPCAGAGGKMLESLRAAARFLQAKVGWHRIGLLLSLTIICIAVYVLVHTLRGLDTGEVLAALKAVELHRIAIAGL